VTDAAASPPATTSPDLLGKDGGVQPGKGSLPVPWSAGVQHLSPGAAFLDSMLSLFHTMVARPICVRSSEVVKFWIIAADRSPRINIFCVANALNFNLTAFPDRLSSIMAAASSPLARPLRLFAISLSPIDPFVWGDVYLSGLICK
jgi:hypothetical protein